MEPQGYRLMIDCSPPPRKPPIPRPIQAWGIRSKHSEREKARLIERSREDANRLALLLEGVFKIPHKHFLEPPNANREGLTDKQYKLTCRIRWFLVRELEAMGYDTEVLVPALRITLNVIYKGRNCLRAALLEDAELREGLETVKLTLTPDATD